MIAEERERFDRLLEAVLEELPPGVLRLLDEAPLIVEDHPSDAMMRELGFDGRLDELCGLYTGVPLIDRSVDAPAMMPDHIHIFREGIVGAAGGWLDDRDEDGRRVPGEDIVREEIRITILHEIGHHFGLDEDDLEGLGYG